MGNKLKFKVPPECDNIKAQNFLRNQCNLSSRMITRLKREKDGILMEGKILRTVDFVKSGKVVEINMPSEKSAVFPVCGDINIMFEDSNLLVVNKPPSMPVHPVKQHQCDTLANIVSYYSLQKGESYVFRAVNRLDKDTSGLVVIAKDRFTANSIKNKINKFYYAICHGRLEGENTINKPIGMQDGSIMVRRIKHDGLPSVTHYKSLFSSDEFSFVKLWLETGRTHQIRCHMSSIGHPLLGDDLYGGKLDKLNRQALHCGEIEFIHPVNGNKINIKADLPNDMKAVLNEKARID